VNRAELSDQNFRRISWINILLSPPLFLLFAWPYVVFALRFDMPELMLQMGTFCFSFPFTLTIIHGHVTAALGALHRIRYYEWLAEHRWSYGFFIRPIFFSTRFRLIFLLIGFVILFSGVML
jgi:hypothetical protein